MQRPSFDDDVGSPIDERKRRERTQETNKVSVLFDMFALAFFDRALISAYY
jgi:hypothetical protein